ncbi:MAG: hypothetical protein L3K24_14555 [Gammaproteobacteria bacterium]|nr:hypothetical protein [Gammaproteobacteria bacterium]
MPKLINSLPTDSSEDPLKQGVLFNLAVNPFGFHEAVGIIRLAGLAAFDGGAANEHSRSLPQVDGQYNPCSEYYGPTSQEETLSHCLL